MAYSTVIQFRSNISKMSKEVISDDDVEQQIAKADVDVNLWLIENGIDSAEISAMPDTPNVINLMSQYGTCVYVLMTQYAHMETIPEDLEFWQKKRDKLFEGNYQIKVGNDVLFSQATASIDNTHSSDLYFGYNRFGRNV